MDKNHMLMLAVGNSGRGDDGLGWLFAEKVNSYYPEKITVEYRYQLQVEDAWLVSTYPVVLFVDASHETLKNGYALHPCKAASHYFFSSHIQSPETILYLTQTLYGSFPKAYLLTISGYSWQLGEGLSERAAKNLFQSLQGIETWLKSIQIIKKQLHRPAQKANPYH